MKNSRGIEYTIGAPMPGTKWVVRGKLGEGGMGLVLEVVKAGMIAGAMKILLPPFAQIQEFAERFLDEVKVTARLQHRNIVQVLDFDRLADGTPFMVMELLRGRTLRAALRETRLRGHTWTPANTYAIAAQVAEGLYRAHAHAPPIVHRDVKPENIYLHRAEASFESVVKVMDFGIAAVVGETDRQVIGTPRYMAPEQMAGDQVSPQSDQYALGLVVYEMLTGRFPWDVDVRDAAALARVHRHTPPAPPTQFCPWLPSSVEATLLRALSKDPAARHDTVHGLVFELRALQSLGDPSSAAAEDPSLTEPMVGTLADGGARLHDPNDTSEGIDAPPVEGASPQVPRPTTPSQVSVEINQSGDDATYAVASALSRQALLGHAPADQTAGDSDASPTLAEQLDTPMTGESVRGLLERGDARWRALRVWGPSVLAIGSAAAVAALVSMGTVAPLRPSLRQAASQTAREAASAPPVRAVVEALPPVAPALPFLPAAPKDAVGRVPTPDVARSVTPSPAKQALQAPPPRSPPRAGSSKPPPVTDDGRDELYTSEAP